MNNDWDDSDNNMADIWCVVWYSVCCIKIYCGNCYVEKMQNNLFLGTELCIRIDNIAWLKTKKKLNGVGVCFVKSCVQCVVYLYDSGSWNLMHLDAMWVQV